MEYEEQFKWVAVALIVIFLVSYLFSQWELVALTILGIVGLFVLILDDHFRNK